VAARAARLLRLRCPECGRESDVHVTPDTLAAAAASPTGLVGVADYHGDHVMVVYVDGEGRDRGVRVFRALQRGEVVRANPTYLAYMSNIAGFRVASEGWSLEGFAGSPRALLRVLGGGGALEVELRDLARAPQAAAWGERFLEALSRVGQPDLSGLLLSILLLDASMQHPPSPFASRMFELALNVRRLTLRVDPDSADLLSAYAHRVPWLSPRVLEFARRVDGWPLLRVVAAPDPLTMRERMATLLSLERRGVVRFEVTEP